MDQLSPVRAVKKPAIKYGLIFVIILAVLTAQNGRKVVVGAEISSKSTDLSQPLGQLDSYVAVRKGVKSPLVYSKAYVLLDSDSAETIIAQNADESLPIASTTKMTTALVALEKLPLDKVVTISSEPPKINGSVIGLKTGEQMTILSLLKGLLIHSGNDAAMTLAEAYSGTEGDSAQFVAAMNEYVKSHHILSTTFSDPAGLDDDTGRSTPQDLAQITRLLLQQPTLAAIVSTPAETITSVDGQISHQLKNTNRLIESDSAYYLPSALGVKTGYTPAAGHCLIAAYRWQGRTLIGVVMNTNESSNSASAAEMFKLFRWADNSLELRSY